MANHVVVQMWEESELGWGTRPDGYSLHLSVADSAVCVARYWREMPKRLPDEYSRPCGNPYVAEVSDDVYQKIVESTHGIRCFGRPPAPYLLGEAAPAR